MGIKKTKQRVRRTVLTAGTRGDVQNGFPAPRTNNTRVAVDKLKQIERRPVLMNESFGSLDVGFPAKSLGNSDQPYDYFAADPAELTALLTQPGAATTLANKVVALGPGRWDNVVISARINAPVTLASFNTALRTELRKPLFLGSKNVHILNLKVTSDDTTPCLRVRSTAAAGYVENFQDTDCEFIGHYEGVVDNPAFDPTNPVNKHYACIIPVFTNGVLTNIQFSTVNSPSGPIQMNYVGDLVPDGPLTLTFQYAPNSGVTTGGVTWPGGNGTKPTATVNVVGGYIQPIGPGNITSGGSGAVNEGTATLANGTYNSGNAMSCIQWSGWSPMTDHLTFAAFDTDSTNGGYTETNDQVIRGYCRHIRPTVRLVRNGFKHQAAPEQIIVRGFFKHIYEDAVSQAISELQTKFHVVNNLMISNFSADGHPDDPHADGIQTFPATSGPYLRTSHHNAQVHGNFIISDIAWADVQGILMRMNYGQSSAKVSGVAANNVVLSRKKQNSIFVDSAINFFGWRNLTRHSDTYANDTDSVDCGIHVGGAGTLAEGVILGKNMAEIWPVPTAVNSTAVWDHLTYPNATNKSDTAFAAYSKPTSRADALAKIALSGVGQWTNSNYGPLGGGFNFDAEDVASIGGDTPVLAAFSPLIGQNLSSAVWSGWAPVLGLDGLVTVATSTQYQIADDSSGTNASIAATSGSFTLDGNARKYIRVLINTSGANRAVTSATVTLNGTVSTAYAQTTSLTVYPTANNGGTAYSVFNPGSKANIVKGIIARRTLINSHGSANSNVLAGKSASNFASVETFQSPYEERLQLVNGTTHLARFMLVNNPTGQWNNDIFAFDWTKNTSAFQIDQVCKMTRNLVRQHLDTKNSVITATAATPTTFSVLFGTTPNQGMGILATTTGGGKTNRQIEWVWAWFGIAADTMPDIHDPAIASKFNADNFGANGNAAGALPTPQIFGRASVGGNGPTTWSGSFANAGSVAGNFVGSGAWT